jgi:putative Ca2+/H+ antiporter (TMEM165/GDT1 family)
MDWKTVGATFGLVFLAEIGDRTQLATLTLAAGRGAKLAVFLGASAALVASSAIAVLVAEGVGRALPVVWLRRAAAVGFLAMGVWLLVRAD